MSSLSSKLFTAAAGIGLLYLAILGVTSLRKKPSQAVATKTQQIERIERYGLYARGNNPRVAVDYIDRRSSEVEVHYNDEDTNGHVDQVTYFSNGKPRITFVVHIDERLTEKAYLECFKDGRQFAMTDGPKIAIWAKSPEGKNLDGRYWGMVFEYHKLHPEAVLPESESIQEPVRVGIVKNLGALADEYLERKRDARKNRTGRAGEIDHYRWYLAEGYLLRVYGQLNDRERSALFDWDHELSFVALQVGRKLSMVFMDEEKKAWAYWPRNPQRKLDEWRHQSQEIDFMSAFSIAREFDKQEAAYKNELRRRGLSI